MAINMATKEFGDSPIEAGEEELSQGNSETISRVREDVDHDEVYSYEEQQKIIRRM
jgi:hypothetical protein